MRGPTWGRIGQPDMPDGVDVRGEPDERRIGFAGICGPIPRGIHTRGRVSVEAPDGTVLRARDRAHASHRFRDDLTVECDGRPAPSVQGEE